MKRTKEEKKQIVQEFKSGDVGIVEFAKSKNISANTLYRWMGKKKKMRKNDLASGKPVKGKKNPTIKVKSIVWEYAGKGNDSLDSEFYTLRNNVNLMVTAKDFDSLFKIAFNIIFNEFLKRILISKDKK